MATALRKEIHTLAAKVKAEEKSLTNVQKRVYYYEAEMLWRKVEDQLSEEDAKPLHDSIDELENSFLKLTAAQLTKTAFRRGVQRLDMLIRIITCSLYLCLLGVLTFLPMVIIVPIIDRLLLSIGWPKRYLVYEISKTASAKGFLLLAGVFFSEEGRHKEYESPFLLLFQHGSNLDGFIILDSFPQFFKSIGKDDIFLTPFVGWMAYVFGILPIDRKHRGEAIKQLARATRVCKSGVCLALSPEGTRSKSGQLMRFKKGPFYVQAEANAAVCPLVILGNYELWPPDYMFTCPGQVVIRYLPPIKPGDLPDRIAKNKDAYSRYVRNQMFEAILDLNSKVDKYKPGAPLTWCLRAVNVLCIILFWIAAWALWQGVSIVREYYQISHGTLWASFVVYSITVTASLYILYCKTPA